MEHTLKSRKARTTKTMSGHSGKEYEFDWSSFIPSAITNSMGGSMLLGSILAVPGALAGGAFGIVVSVWSEYAKKKKTETIANN